MCFCKVAQPASLLVSAVGRVGWSRSDIVGTSIRIKSHNTDEYNCVFMYYHLLHLVDIYRSFALCLKDTRGLFFFFHLLFSNLLEK